ncbi:MAG: VOC family protein, partial [Chloroflexota bacterium]
MNHSFIWTDLSTFDVRTAKQFYRDCFGWRFNSVGQGYLVCSAGQHPAAGLYRMPDFFQKINMPSFWMSYIQVSNIDEIVQKAEQLGAKIEVQPQEAPGGGLVALIRDPAGAGFTCYQGDEMGGRDDGSTLGRMVWNELHVSDLAVVESFYTQLFQWEIRPTPQSDRFEIYSAEQSIAGIQVSPNEVKGDKEYWGVYFLVDSLSKAQARIERAGGQVAVEQPLGTRSAWLAYDSQGAAFYIVGNEEQTNSSDDKPTSTFKWRAILGLLLVVTAIFLEADWVWGLLFLLWVIPDIRSGVTYFFEPVERQQNPIIYWLIVSTWSVLS